MPLLAAAGRLTRMSNEPMRLPAVPEPVERGELVLPASERGREPPRRDDHRARQGDAHRLDGQAAARGDPLGLARRGQPRAPRRGLRALGRRAVRGDVARTCRRSCARWPCRSPTTTSRRRASCASPRPSSSAGSKACSTASRRPCSPSSSRPASSSSRCASCPPGAMPGIPVRPPVPGQVPTTARARTCRSQAGAALTGRDHLAGEALDHRGQRGRLQAGGGAPGDHVGQAVAS